MLQPAPGRISASRDRPGADREGTASAGSSTDWAWPRDEACDAAQPDGSPFPCPTTGRAASSPEWNSDTPTDGSRDLLHLQRCRRSHLKGGVVLGGDLRRERLARRIARSVQAFAVPLASRHLDSRLHSPRKSRGGPVGQVLNRPLFIGGPEVGCDSCCRGRATSSFHSRVSSS